MREADGRQVVTTFHQDPARSGLPMAREVRDAQGVLLAATEWTYTQDGDGLPPFTTLVQARTTLEYDGAAVPRRSRTEFEYDGGGAIVRGNVTRESVLGEVGPNNEDLNLFDSRVTAIDYVVNESTNRTLVRRENVRSGTSGFLGESIFFYDGSENSLAVPSIGNLTKIHQNGGGLSPERRDTTFEYDEFGNIIRIVRPRQNATDKPASERLGDSIEYDPLFHTFPVAVENALGHRTVLSYTSGAECSFAYPPGGGLVAIAQDPNALAAQEAWTRCYDPFGRIVTERAPADLAASQWSYEDEPGAVRVIARQRVDAGGEWRTRRSEVDGLGRVFQVVTS